MKCITFAAETKTKHMEKINTYDIEKAMNIILRLMEQLDVYASTWQSRVLYAIVEDIMSYSLFSAALSYLQADDKLKYTLGVGYSLK